MSIYSGFATRNQQQFYDKILYSLISTLMVRINKFYKKEPIDQNTFRKMISEQDKVLKKMEKRKYLDPKYGELLHHFKVQLYAEDENPSNLDNYRQDNLHNNRKKSHIEENHMNRTLSLLGKQFGELRDHVENLQKPLLSEEDEINRPSLAKIEERKKHVSKKKKKDKKISIKSNLDIWDMRQEKPPELPSLHPLHQISRNTLNKTKFNNFSEKMRSKEIEEPPSEDDEHQSLKRILNHPPKFRAKMFFK